jgi:hypothetical protein
MGSDRTMAAAGSFEMLITLYPTTQLHIPDDHYNNTCCHKNFNPRTKRQELTSQNKKVKALQSE